MGRELDQHRICKRLGHWARECNQRKKPATENAEVNGVSYPLVSPTRVYVTAKVNGKPIRCLSDSGCERSVIARSLVSVLRLTSHYVLSAANGTDLPVIRDVDLHFTIDGHNVCVSPAAELLLGSD